MMTSGGVPASLAEHTLTLRFNDINSVKECFSELGDQIACIIVEPVAGNMNCIPPEPGFLETLRDVCTEYGAVLIFDEVMTGFARTGTFFASDQLKNKPDILCLSKKSVIVLLGEVRKNSFGK